MSTVPAAAQRPLRADAQRNRGRILDAAKQVFSEQGIDAQMDDVAARAGVGVGTVYRHFANKDVLLGALVKDKFDSFTERARAALDEPDAWEAFCGLVWANAEHMSQDVGLQDTLRRATTAWEYAEDSRLELQKVTSKLIKRAQREGKLRKDFTVDELAMLMGGLCATMGPGAYPATFDWRRHLEIMLDGLRTGPR
jgi:AcrR family transcriptional regulator